MSQDDLTRNGAGDALSHGGTSDALPDEGMIHEWLDGALDQETSARFEALVASSPAFAERVAEARGLVAAASRILLSLDQVPAGVLPAASAPAATADSGVPDISRAARNVDAAKRGGSHRTRSLARWGSIAAVLMVGATSVLVARRSPAPVENESALVSESLAPTSALSLPTDSAAPVASAAAMVAAPLTTEQSPSRDERRSAMQSVNASAAKAAPPEPVRVVGAPELLPSPANRAAERVAADPALRPGLSAMISDSGLTVRQNNVASAPATVGRRTAAGFAAAGAADSEVMGAARIDAAASEFTPVASDIARQDLVLAVQQVICRPNCVQTRLEIASDGRLRRWVQTIGGGAPADTGRVSEQEVGAVRALVDSLQLATLPAMVRLDGQRCATVGSLRESMRVEFRHEGALRSVMGLPWCSDGTHVLDRILKAVQALATQHLRGASRD